MLILHGEKNDSEVSSSTAKSEFTQNGLSAAQALESEPFLLCGEAAQEDLARALASSGVPHPLPGSQSLTSNTV